MSWSSRVYPRDGRMAPYPQINHCDTLHCCCFSVVQSCDLLQLHGWHMPGSPVLYHLLELSQTHVHWVSDVIQPSHLLWLLFLWPSIFLASGSFPMNRLFTSGRQSIGVSASTSVLSMNIQHWFPLGLTDLLAVPEILKSLLQHHSSKASILRCSAFFTVQLSHPYMTLVKP